MRFLAAFTLLLLACSSEDSVESPPSSPLTGNQGGKGGASGGGGSGDSGQGGAAAGSNAGGAGQGGGVFGPGGSGGAAAGNGGSNGGSGGSDAGAGGAGGSSSGAGGSAAGVGGSDAGAGGSDAGSGGSDAGSGGAAGEGGGAAAGSGGSDAGSGGSTAGAGGSDPGGSGSGGSPDPPTVCGDGACGGDESCGACPSDCGACPPVCGNGACESGENCSSCAADCGACQPVVTHETEFVTWNVHNNAGCEASNGVAKWSDRNDGPGPLSIQGTLLAQDPAILVLQEDGVLGPAGCAIGTVKDKIAGWLAGTHDVRSTDDVSGSADGERYGIFIKKSKYQFSSAGYQKCFYGGKEVRGFLWAEVDLISDATSNHFYVLNAHFKAFSTAADIAERKAQAQCVIAWVKEKKSSNPNRAHFLLGDLNSGPDHNAEAYEILTGADGPFENTSTASPDSINTHSDHWIDHVLGTKGDFTKAGYESWTIGAGQVQNGGTLSDHLGLRTRIGHLK